MSKDTVRERYQDQAHAKMAPKLRIFAGHSLRQIVLAAMVLTCLIAEVWAQGAVISTYGRSGGVSVDIPIHKSDVIRSARPFHEVAVGNPDIADVQVLGDRSVYVFGRQFGSTSVTMADDAGRIIAVVDVNVIHDVGRLRRMLHAVLPEERVEVRAAYDGIVLSGAVSSATSAARAVAVAERFAPDQVSNLISVSGSQQVMLAVRFVEMRRNVLKRLGINATGSVGQGAISILGDLVNLATLPVSVGSLGVNVQSGADRFSGVLDALEEKGAIRTLAEPTLVAMSGDTADFLAGGEFPLPVGADDGRIEIEFKNFGVSLAFTPTVLQDGLINLRLSMEVSEPDRTLDLQLQGVAIPGLTVRRTTTTVELRNAESFAVSGLLRENFANDVRQLPFIGDIPILGALTRSTEFQTGQTELVMIVTPYLAQPVSGGRLQTPGFIAPSERALFLDGTIEGDVAFDPGLHGVAGFSGLYGFTTW